jgi:hypothetical protein
MQLATRYIEPSTKQRLKRSHVVPNRNLRAMIEDWLEVGLCTLNEVDP